MLVDLKEPLGETIPDFHNMELRLRQLREAVSADKAGRVASVKDMIAELESYADEMCLAERLYREGALPKRICHCDTKVNNMMFDKDGKVLCVIDLDTVMPSFIFSDYGDFLRTGANHVAEDSDNYDAVGLKEDVSAHHRRISQYCRQLPYPCRDQPSSLRCGTVPIHAVRSFLD